MMRRIGVILYLALLILGSVYAGGKKENRLLFKVLDDNGKKISRNFMAEATYRLGMSYIKISQTGKIPLYAILKENDVYVNPSLALKERNSIINGKIIMNKASDKQIVKNLMFDKIPQLINATYMAGMLTHQLSDNEKKEMYVAGNAYITLNWKTEVGENDYTLLMVYAGDEYEKIDIKIKTEFFSGEEDFFTLYGGNRTYQKKAIAFLGTFFTDNSFRTYLESILHIVMDNDDWNIFQAPTGLSTIIRPVSELSAMQYNFNLALLNQFPFINEVVTFNEKVYNIPCIVLSLKIFRFSEDFKT